MEIPVVSPIWLKKMRGDVIIVSTILTPKIKKKRS